MRTTTRRAAQIVAIALAGAGALTAGAGPAAAGPIDSVASATRASTVSSTSTSLSSSTIVDVGSLVLREINLTRPPVICCGNLGPVADIAQQLGVCAG
jgi:hypothetical protein